MLYFQNFELGGFNGVLAESHHHYSVYSKTPCHINKLCSAYSFIKY